jgi:YesN/AraC family two-component response regulator
MGDSIHGHKPLERFQVYCWTIHLYMYSGEITVEGKPYPIKFGYMGINPPSAETEYRFFEKKCRHIYGHFECSPGKNQKTVLIPVMMDISKYFTEMNSSMERMFKNFTVNKLRAEVQLWDILFELASISLLQQKKSNRQSPVVHNAMSLIERKLSEPVYARDIAKEVGYSPNHLNRLFKEIAGNPLKEYIIKRKMERASHLLKNSNISVKEIAWQCGIPDLQSFNKTIRKYFGKSPRAFRE